MPLIEELPVTQTVRVSHGWAYVPDTGPIAAVQPGTRKRGARDGASGGRGDGGTAKQQRAIEKRLADLEKENYKDVHIPIPSRSKDRGKKMTSNVRRILTYQRTFAHYLAEEEALLAQTGSNTYALPPTMPTQRSREATVVTSAETPKKKAGPTRTTSSTPAVKTEQTPSSTSMPPPPTPQRSTPSRAPSQPPAPVVAPLPADLEPLLSLTNLPKPPSDRVMQALLAEPPLSYAAARAKPLGDPKPPRHFCVICGYWGQLRCRGCGDRTCSSRECYHAHRDGCDAILK